MKAFKYILLFSLLFFLLNCAKKTNSTSEINSEKVTKKNKKIIKKKPLKAWDSLTKKNLRGFFKTYGEQNKETKVLITTDFGKIKIKLYNDTPLHRASFIFLTKIGYFTNTVFYRVVKDFVIQGGDSEDFSKSKMRYKYENYKLPAEFKKNRRHKYGALAAAREWEWNPNKVSTPFEFYIVQSKNGAHHLNNEHTVFGEVISGFSTLEKISNVKIGPGEWPVDDIFMKVEVID